MKYDNAYLNVSNEQSLSGYEPKKLFHQLPDGNFEECSFADGFSSRSDGRSLIAADLDGDGDQDLLMLNRGEPKLQLFENRSKTGNKSLELRFLRKKGVRDGTGAELLVTSGGKTRKFAVVLARGFASAVPARVHVGLGTEDLAEVEVHWPGGKSQRFSQLHAGSTWTLAEDDPTPKQLAYVSRTDPAPVHPPVELRELGVGKRQAAFLGTATTLVAFLSKGCAPCKAEIPELNRLASQNAVHVIGVSTDDEDEAGAKATATAMGATFAVLPLYKDAARKMESMGSLTLPLSIVYTPDGRWSRVIHSLDAFGH